MKTWELVMWGVIVLTSVLYGPETAGKFFGWFVFWWVARWLWELRHKKPEKKAE